ncbi:ribonuclease H-like domain-containing protein, partial [Lentinula edodes]|uniref:ribonuclease H-like domain-containing protein n=1 Tax=Lentinula edodes TaxID=5353 RepID=UPI001E8D7425
FRTFFQKWLPDAHVPDRRVLAGRLLSDLANGVIVETREKVNGKLGTYQADGWKNVAKTNVNTSLITVEGKSHLVKTHDMTGRPKTGDEYYSIMEEDIEYIKKVYGVDVICVCTDDGPDGKKARRLVREKQPTIATTQCWSHQMGLSTGDYLKLKLPFMLAASQAIEVIKWWNNHNKAHDLLKAQQLTISMKVLQLILPVITRWTAHYCSLRRVEHLERAIRGCVGAHFEQLLLAGGNRADQKQKAEEVMAYCQSPVFWLNLKRIVRHLEPLAIAANILQGDSVRFDHVLLTLGNLYRIFGNLPIEDHEVSHHMQTVFERRWKNCDQELFILAVFFNPYIRSKCFNHDTLTQMALMKMAGRIFERLTGQKFLGDTGFMIAFQDYYSGIGVFSDGEMCLSMFKATFEAADEPLDLVKLWQSLDGNPNNFTGQSGFVKLAIRILSMVPNSAGAERVFSAFGFAHTKHRNKLDSQKVHESTLVRQSNIQKHQETGEVKKRKQR